MKEGGRKETGQISPRTRPLGLGLVGAGHHVTVCVVKATFMTTLSRRYTLSINLKEVF